MNTPYTPTPETALIPVIKEHFLLNVVNKSGVPAEYSVGEEIRSQYGIPDLLFYNFHNEVLDMRMERKIAPILSKEVLKTLLLIQNREKITLSFLQENLPLSKDVIKNKVVRYLLNNNYLNKSLADCEAYWMGDIKYESCIKNMFAVEAKISNWKRGFYQAYRYKWFSNYSFLALHDRFVKPAMNNFSLFVNHNIGLMSVDPLHNTIKLLHRPKKEMPYSKEFAAMTFEKLFADYCEKKATSQSAQSSCVII